MGQYYSMYNILPEDHYDKVREIKQIFCGKLDNFTIYDSVIERQKEWDSLNLKFVKKVELSTSSTLKDNSINFTLNPLYTTVEENTEKNTFYSNIRLSSEKYSDLIKSCQLVVGDNVFETLDVRSSKVLNHIYKLPSPRTLPFHFCSAGNKIPVVGHNLTQIKFFFNEKLSEDIIKDFKIKADVYELVDKPENFNVYLGGTIASHIITQSDFHGIYKITNQEFKLPIYSRVISHIMISVPDNEIEELRLECSTEKSKNKKILNIQVNQLEKFDDTYVIPLTKSLNLSDLKKYGINFGGDNRHSLFIKLKNKLKDKEQQCKMFSLGTNIEVYSGGFSGLRYAK